MSKFFNSRFFMFLILPLFIVGWFVVTDPSKGADTLMRIQIWAQAFLVTGLTYTIDKSLMGKASSEDLYDLVKQGNVAAGHAYLGARLSRAIVLVGLLIFFAMLQR